MTNNLFALFDDKPGWKQAEGEIKAACLRFQAEIRELQERHREVGAEDTQSREEIGRFVGQLVGGCADECLNPEWFVIDRRWRGSGITWGEAREKCVEAGELPPAH
jgi:hypothetical protein